MILVYNHLLCKVFRFHYHSQHVIGSLGNIPFFLHTMTHVLWGPHHPRPYGGPGAIGEIGPGKGAIDHDSSGVPNCQPIPSKPRWWFETFFVYTYTIDYHRWLGSRCWFQILFSFIPIWGDDPIWLIFLSNLLVQPPNRKGKGKTSKKSNPPGCLVDFFHSRSFVE